MKILKLKMENVLKIKALQVVPESQTINIKGENGAGKSSILDAIVMNFKGDRDLPKEPIKRGAKKGIITVDIDGDPDLQIPPFTITRTITPKSTSTKIEPDTVLFGDTPRSFLDKLIGKISFDPLAFINQEGPKQRAALLELIGVDVDALDKKEKDLYDERKLVNRDLKTAKAKLESLNTWPEIKETEEIKVEDFSTRIQEAMKTNADINGRIEANDKRKSDVIARREQIAQLELQIAAHEKFIVETKAEYMEEKEALKEVELVDIGELNQQLSTISETNSKIRDNIAYQAETATLTSIQNEYDRLDKAVEAVREERVQLIQDADIPVPGLTFDEAGLLYNDIPLSQCSDGEKLMVSMGISMALNPTVRVLLIKDGSLLDSKNRKILDDMCKDKGFQLWMESVASKDEYDASGQVGIFIEEGEAIGDGVVETILEPVKKEGKGPGKKTDKDPVVKSNAEDDDDW
ncbi:MAG: AAA family ATPase [Dehalococcoidales bacterium]